MTNELSAARGPRVRRADTWVAADASRRLVGDRPMIYLPWRQEGTAMEITDVRAELARPERSVGIESAVKRVEQSTCVIVTIEASDGSRGVGEIPDIENPEDMPSTAEIEAEMARFLLGRDPRRVHLLAEEMGEVVDFGPDEFHSFQQLALGAIDMALYDLVGHRYDVPAYQLLGGRTRDVPICWVVFTRRGDDRFEKLREEVRTRVEQGFEAFKLKVGEAGVDVDRRRIEAVREIAGEDATVLIDAQGVWDLDQAVETIEELAPAGVDGVETPVGHPDASVDAPGYYYDVPLLPEELREVREAVDVPILEHVLDPAFGLALAQNQAVDVFTVEAPSGGITRAQRALQIAEAADIDARLGSTVELEPGTMAGAALAAASPAVTYPCDLIGPLVYEDSVVERSLPYEDGHLRLSERPGFGIDLQERYR